MAFTMSGNYIFAGPNDRCYKVASNFTNYLELGLPDSGDYYLEARIDEGDFKINARLWDTASGEQILVKDNFPTGMRGVTRDDLPNGYLIKDSGGVLILGIAVEGNLVRSGGAVRSKDGALIAEDKADDFLIHRGPAVLGKEGSARGIVIS